MQEDTKNIKKRSFAEWQRASRSQADQKNRSKNAEAFLNWYRNGQNFQVRIVKIENIYKIT